MRISLLSMKKKKRGGEGEGVGKGKGETKRGRRREGEYFPPPRDSSFSKGRRLTKRAAWRGESSKRPALIGCIYLYFSKLNEKGEEREKKGRSKG